VGGAGYALWCRELAQGARRRRTRVTAETTLYLGPKWFRAFRDLEQSASQIMQVASEIVPGNLQTESYTRAMVSGRGSFPDHQTVEDIVRVRRDRQALLTREDAAQFTFVLSESALRRVIGGPKVMAEQLRHLAELALLPTVDIQVIPFDTLSYEPLSYTFTVLRFDHDSATDIVYIDMYDNAVYWTSHPRRYAATWSCSAGCKPSPWDRWNRVTSWWNWPASSLRNQTEKGLAPCQPHHSRRGPGTRPATAMAGRTTASRSTTRVRVM
jgi:Domain of unknown function (DUF5753)